MGGEHGMEDVNIDRSVDLKEVRMKSDSFFDNRVVEIIL